MFLQTLEICSIDNFIKYIIKFFSRHLTYLISYLHATVYLTNAKVEVACANQLRSKAF